MTRSSSELLALGIAGRLAEAVFNKGVFITSAPGVINVTYLVRRTR